MKFDRYRAYAEGEGTRSERGPDGKKQVVESWPTETVAFEGKAAADGTTAEFDAAKTKITRVVFYCGALDNETVVGSVEVGKSGKISASSLPAAE